MKLYELLTLIGVTKAEFKPGISKDSQVIIMPEESDGFDVKDVIYFQKEQQMWFVIDEGGDRWLTEKEEDDEEEFLCEREGDMCALPEVSGEVKCSNPFCKDGHTEAGPCFRCNSGCNPRQEIKPDPCESARLKAKRA